MIFILLAALFGAAQEVYVVYEGAETTYSVDEQATNSYLWEVYVGFNPEEKASDADFEFLTAATASRVSVLWNQAGVYYVSLTDTDPGGCSNRKVVTVQVINDSRSIAFANLSSAACYDASETLFTLDLEVLGNNGESLEPTYFPLEIDFDVGGTSFSQQIDYESQYLDVAIDLGTEGPENDTTIVVELLSATDNVGQEISVLEQNAVCTHVIYAKPQLEFLYADSSVNFLSYGSYKVNAIGNLSGEIEYNWWLDLPEGSTTNLDSFASNEASVLWNGAPGVYKLYVSVVDENGCSSDTLVREIEVAPLAGLSVDAGKDTTIGACQPFVLQASVSDTTGVSYAWQPADYLNDPTLLNPVFTPGESTDFILAVSTSTGETVYDTVLVTVVEVFADAGNDVVLEEESTVILDGSGSSGQGLSFLWTTSTGTIDNGANTAFPQISEAGVYYLEVSDAFGCSAFDSVEVNRVTYAPVLEDMRDTTTFQESLTISVLDNYEGSEDEIDLASLEIVQYPVNGQADINYMEGTVTYTPDDGFLGSDVFEYSICNFFDQCDNALVYVYVTPLEFLIPDAFSPNGDNINDYFEIKGIEMFPNNSLVVINRWGKKVYQAEQYGINTSPVFWDGKSNQGGGNGDVPTGTYFYVLNLGNGEKPIAGSVYIDR